MTTETDLTIARSTKAATDRTRRDLYRDFDPRGYTTEWLQNLPEHVSRKHQKDIDAVLDRRQKETLADQYLRLVGAAFLLCAWGTYACLAPVTDTTAAKVRQEMGAATANPLGEVRPGLTEYQERCNTERDSWIIDLERSPS